MIGNSGARWFLGTVFLLLVVTAAAKVVSAFEGTPLLARYDTLLPLSVRQTLLLAAAVECACALVVLMRGLERVSCLVVACLGGEFLLYHLAVHMTGMPGPCPCLGRLTAWAGLSDKSAQTIVVAIAAYLVLGGIYFHWCSAVQPSEGGPAVHSSATPPGCARRKEGEAGPLGPARTVPQSRASLDNSGLAEEPVRVGVPGDRSVDNTSTQASGG
jgi:hypothetical protein